MPDYRRPNCVPCDIKGVVHANADEPPSRCLYHDLLGLQSVMRCNNTSNAGSSQVAHNAPPAAVALLLCTLIKEPENAGSMCTRRAKRMYLLAVCVYVV